MASSNSINTFSVRKQFDQYTLRIVVNSNSDSDFNWKEYVNTIIQKAKITKMKVYKTKGEDLENNIFYYFIVSETQFARNVFLQNESNKIIKGPKYYRYKAGFTDSYPTYQSMDSFPFNFDDPNTYTKLCTHGNFKDADKKPRNLSQHLDFFSTLETAKAKLAYIHENNLQPEAAFLINNSDSLKLLERTALLEEKGLTSNLSINNDMLQNEENILEQEPNLNQEDETPVQESVLNQEDETPVQESVLNWKDETPEQVPQEQPLFLKLLKSPLKTTSLIDDNKESYTMLLKSFFAEQNRDQTIKFLEGLQGPRVKYTPFLNLASAYYKLKKSDPKAGAWYKILEPYIGNVIPEKVRLIKK